MKHAISWFDLPATDIERAVKFYNTILGAKMEAHPMMEGYVGAFFPCDMQEGVGGDIIQGEGYTPTDTGGTLIYLNAGDDLAPVLGRVEAAGGKVLMPKTSLGENGWMASFIDSEGNRVGLHSMQ